jgi:hypothetical protein
VHDPRLRALADEGSADDVVSVIIEVEVPSPRFTAARRPGIPGGDRRVGAVRPQLQTSGEATSTTRREEAARFLGRLLGSVPRWLPAAHAFVADVTGAQLAEIARSPLTRSVAVNRSFGAPGV